jgi:hypothetical protein
MELREVREEEDLDVRLSGLRLSEAEKRGVKGIWLNLEEGGGKAQVVGKLFAEKPGRAEGIIQTLGKIWCPIKGIIARSLVTICFSLPSCNRVGREGRWRRVPGILVVICSW